METTKEQISSSKWQDSKTRLGRFILVHLIKSLIEFTSAGKSPLALFVKEGHYSSLFLPGEPAECGGKGRLGGIL